MGAEHAGFEERVDDRPRQCLLGFDPLLVRTQQRFEGADASEQVYDATTTAFCSV